MPTSPTEEDRRLTPVLAEDRVCTGVTTLRGRVFLSYPSADRPGTPPATSTTSGSTTASVTSPTPVRPA